MSSHQEMPSVLASLEHGGSLIHTVNIAPLSLLLESMDPEPTANPHAELVMECFQECRPLGTTARDWSPVTPPDSMTVEGLGWGGVGEPAGDDKGENSLQDGEIVDIFLDEGCKESTVPPSYLICLPGLASHGGDRVGQGEQASVFQDRTKWDVVGGCTLPSLKELGLDVYVEKRN